MDFMERLAEKVNSTPNLPIRCKLGYLSAEESFCLYSIPGSRVNTEYYDGSKDQNLNYELMMKSKSQKLINTTLWLVQNYLEEISEIKSSDNSFEFEGISVTNKPYINQLSETGFYIFSITIQASITTKK